MHMRMFEATDCTRVVWWHSCFCCCSGCCRFWSKCLKWPRLMYKQHSVWMFLFEKSLMNSCQLLIVQPLEAKVCGMCVPVETSHLFWSLENHFILINQEMPKGKISHILQERKVISIRHPTLTKVFQFHFVVFVVLWFPILFLYCRITDNWFTVYCNIPYTF